MRAAHVIYASYAYRRESSGQSDFLARHRRLWRDNLDEKLRLIAAKHSVAATAANSLSSFAKDTTRHAPVMRHGVVPPLNRPPHRSLAIASPTMLSISRVTA